MLTTHPATAVHTLLCSGIYRYAERGGAPGEFHHLGLGLGLGLRFRVTVRVSVRVRDRDRVRDRGGEILRERRAGTQSHRR